MELVQVGWRLDKDIVEEIQRVAKEEERSVTAVVRRLLRAALKSPSLNGSPPTRIYNSISPPSLISPSNNSFGELVEVKAMKKARATRLPEDFVPDERGREIALSMGLDPQQTLDHFRDYWTSKPGQGGVKLDWQATWRNWCRNTRGPAKAAPRTTGLEGKYDD